MATGQYLSEVAAALAEKGHEVTVVTGRRAYDDPDKLFPARETWRGVRIFRIFSTRFGKATKWRRAADFASFIANCCARLAFLPRHDVVMALTTPPLISFIGAWRAKLWRAPFCYWVMDMNPDEAVAAGWLRADSFVGKMLERMSRFSFHRADRIIALDRFMRDRIIAKGIAPEKIAVIPPWSQDNDVRFDVTGREQFRKAHGLQDKFVVMYSGNHSPVHPLDTLLAAAGQLAADPGVVFCFVGGGSEWRKIADKQKSETRNQKPEAGAVSSHFSFQLSAFSFSNILCLPYQPLDQLAGSLSAADLHVVVMGNAFVGLVHPCKIYNILSVSAPVLYIGPRPSHLSELLDGIDHEYPCAAVAHGEVDLVVRQIESVRRQSSLNSRQSPVRARMLFSKEVLLPKIIAELESA